MIRAMPSVFPPAANGTMIVTGFCGQPCPSACTGAAKIEASRPRATGRNILRVCILCFTLYRRLAHHPDWLGSWLGPISPVGAGDLQTAPKLEGRGPPESISQHNR